MRASYILRVWVGSLVATVLMARAFAGARTEPPMTHTETVTASQPIGLDALFDIDRLPVLRDAVAGMVSSYNRKSWNDDDRPEFLRIENPAHRGKRLIFYTWADDERVDDLGVETAIASGEWRHVAVTWDLADDGKLTKAVYVDGKPVDRRVIDNWRPAEHRTAFPRDADDRLFIASQIGSCWLKGALSDVVLYDRPLSPEEVLGLERRHSAPSHGLVLHLPMNRSLSPVGATLERISSETWSAPGPEGRGALFTEGSNEAFRTAGRISPRHGSFAAWVNPTELVEGQMQHLFCLGADSMGLYLAGDLAGGEGVLADLKGPGCIYRVWLGGDPNRTLHFYFDGETKPRLSLRFNGPHGEPSFGAATWIPLTSGAGDLCYPPMMATGTASAPYLETGICYMPMPFRRSCKITMEPAGAKYVQVNYHLLPAGTKVATFDPRRLSKADLEACRKGRERWWRPAPCEPPVGIAAHDESYEPRLAPGQTTTLCEHPGAGRVTGIWARLPEALRTEEALRGLRLRITFDGDSSPAVDTALGPFFNDFWGTPTAAAPIPLSPDIRGAVPNEQEWAQWSFGMPLEYRGLLFGYTRDAGYYAYFPMPYARGMRVELTNETNKEIRLSFRLRREEWPDMPANQGRFHARYHRENPTEGIEHAGDVKIDVSGARNYRIVDTSGTGHFVGCSLALRRARRIPPEVERLVGDICEGNEMIFVDDDPARTMIGTGSEDYLNQNYWVHDHTYPYDGSRVSYDSCYRLQLSDCVPFRKALHVTIEHGAANAHYIDYSSVAYWYQAGSARP